MPKKHHVHRRSVYRRSDTDKLMQGMMDITKLAVVGEVGVATIGMVGGVLKKP